MPQKSCRVLRRGVLLLQLRRGVLLLQIDDFFHEDDEMDNKIFN